MFTKLKVLFSPLNQKLFSTSSNVTSLSDNFGRRHDYLRISLTERCNLRCRYCMPEDGIQLSDRKDCLNLDELKRLTTIAVESCGIRKIRLTGGEPTVDKKLPKLLEHLNTLRDHGLETVAMTTNGLTLKKQAGQLKDLGLNAVNISLDTLRAERFEFMTRRKGWSLAYQGLLTAIEVKMESTKVNCVVMRGFNDDEILEFANLAKNNPIEVRFIEFMPFAGNRWDSTSMFTYREMLEVLNKEYPELVRLAPTANETSKVYKDPSMLGSIGFISSMSENFCSGCNRLRLTADGNLKVCLFESRETSLRNLMRNGASDQEIIRAVESSLKLKKKQHAGAFNLQANTSRPMIKIGARMLHNTSTSDDDQWKGEFSHLNAKGEANMVNVGAKTAVKRIAIAQGRIQVGPEVLAKIRNGSMVKGNILGVSRIAGIMGAKLTSQLIPLCHQIPLDKIEVEIEPSLFDSLLVTATVEAHQRTGVEMESLTAVSITLLTLYDMCKSVNKSMIMSDIKLISKVKE